jgi:hypothetical protein
MAVDTNSIPSAAIRPHASLTRKVVLCVDNDPAGRRLPAILITANYTEAVRQAADAVGCPILNKPVRPGALRALA